jgi:Na+/H+-dicarboxylate symporter
MRRWFDIPLWLRVIGGLLIGTLVGYAAPEFGASMKPIGDAFVRMIKMLIVPLIFSTLVGGVIAMGDPKRLGSLGGRTIGLYLMTTALAVSIGLAMATLVQPGVGIDVSTADAAATTAVSSKLDAAGSASFVGRFFNFDVAGDLKKFVAKPVENGLLLAFLTIVSFFAARPNPRYAAMFTALVLIGIAIAGLNILTVIAFTLVVGVVILIVGGRLTALGTAIEETSEVAMDVVKNAMELAPFGVAALMAWVIGDKGFGVLANLSLLALALYGACIVQIMVVYGSIVRFLIGMPLRRFLRGIFDAQAFAYSTASSSATLPVTIKNVSENLGVSKSVASAVLPLGATINMDGTAIYLGIVALFAAQALGIVVTPSDYVVVAATATLASVGAAGIPSAGLFLAATVLGVFQDAAGQPLISAGQATLVIAFIFPFDRLLDMMRTMTNVTGDAAVAMLVAKWQGELRDPSLVALDAQAALDAQEPIDPVDL